MIFFCILHNGLVADRPYWFLQQACLNPLVIVFLALKIAFNIFYFSLKFLFLRFEDSVSLLQFI